MKFGDILEKLEYGTLIVLTNSADSYLLLKSRFSSFNLSVFKKFAEYEVLSIITSNEECDLEFVLKK